MPNDTAPDQPSTVINLADARRRLDAEKEDALTPIRNFFMEEMGELFQEYLEEVRTATHDEEKILEEIMAACSTLLTIAAEEHFAETADQIDFINTVAEIATELIDEEHETLDMFDELDDQDPR